MTEQVNADKTPLRLAIVALGEAVYYAMHHVERGTEEDAAAREWLFEMCSWVQWELLPADDRDALVQGLRKRAEAS